MQLAMKHFSTFNANTVNKSLCQLFVVFKFIEKSTDGQALQGNTSAMHSCHVDVRFTKSKYLQQQQQCRFYIHNFQQEPQNHTKCYPMRLNKTYHQTQHMPELNSIICHNKKGGKQHCLILSRHLAPRLLSDTFTLG